MRVIIIKKFEKFREGDIVDVKDGYARNFLIPKGLVLEATKENLQRFENIKKQRLKLEELEKKKYIEIKGKIEKTSITISAEVKNNDELYGSINESLILEALKEEGIELEKDKIQLEEPIKKLGIYNIEVKLQPEITAKLRVWVVKK